MSDLKLATFALDATPPLGSPLCGGWIRPMEATDDPLELRGVVLLGAGPPIVLAALDWTGVLNGSYQRWREGLAGAAGTSLDRVALHTVHQHDAPFVDQRAHDLVVAAPGGAPIFDPKFVDRTLAAASAAIRAALPKARSVQKVGTGAAPVERVASARRVIGPDGKSLHVRYSATRDPKVRDAPIGTIDPLLRSVSFYGEGGPVARLTYYATHPMSHYGKGRASWDFPGLARYRRSVAEPKAFRVHFTGCAGNVTAGKFNDGAIVRRAELADRMENAMERADALADRAALPIERADWNVLPFSFAPRADLVPDVLTRTIVDPRATAPERNRAAMALSFVERCERKEPIDLQALDLGSLTVLGLPGETFVEYQLEAQARSDRPLAVAAYGDGGPWYVPLERSFDEGGYEPSVAFVAKESERAYMSAIARVIGAKG